MFPNLEEVSQTAPCPNDAITRTPPQDQAEAAATAAFAAIAAIEIRTAAAEAQRQTLHDSSSHDPLGVVPVMERLLERPSTCGNGTGLTPETGDR